MSIDYEEYRKWLFEKPMDKERAVKILTRIGILDKNGNWTDKGAMIAEYLSSEKSFCVDDKDKHK